MPSITVRARNARSLYGAVTLRARALARSLGSRRKASRQVREEDLTIDVLRAWRRTAGRRNMHFTHRVEYTSASPLLSSLRLAVTPLASRFEFPSVSRSKGYMLA